MYGHDCISNTGSDVWVGSGSDDEYSDVCNLLWTVLTYDPVFA